MVKATVYLGKMAQVVVMEKFEDNEKELRGECDEVGF
jgi:hypothetical protein